MTLKKHLKTILITVDTDIAQYAERAGVDIVFVDMETRGKNERQGHLDTHKASHTIDDVQNLSMVLNTAELMVRVNPLWSGTAREVSSALAAGANRLMLPMFTRAADVVEFKSLAGVAPVTLLVETSAALARLPTYLHYLSPGDSIHFGLNDLCIDMQLSFLFEVLGGRILDGPTAICTRAGVPFGIGGVGRVGQGSVPSEWLLAEYARLGSEQVILSRAFHRGAQTLETLVAEVDLRREIDSIRRVWAEHCSSSHEQLLSYNRKIAERAGAIVGDK